MAWGPIVRIATQFVLVAGSAAGRAVREAYKEAAKNPSVAAAVRSNRMPNEEARKILEVPRTLAKDKQIAEIAEKAKTMRDINARDAKGVGSPYLMLSPLC